MSRKHWPRWVKASIVKHFDDNRDSETLYIDPFKRPTNEDLSRLELRMDGPDIIEHNFNRFTISMEINCLVQTYQGPTDNRYKHEILTGKAIAIFTSGISVYKYGAGVDDDQTLLGCLVRKGNIIPTNFGTPDDSTDLVHSTVEGQYEMNLEL